MTYSQQTLFGTNSESLVAVPFPTTRYQGSKRKLLSWIWQNVHDLPFDSVLDVFGGTGAVSHLFKRAGKRVIYNDLLHFNWVIGKALIENSDVCLTPEDIEGVLSSESGDVYPTFIQDTFSGIYFTDEENMWLDRVLFNIEQRLDHPYKQSLAHFALFQSCIAKRPYNLFHRANLYMRTAKVERGFGNKTTWDRPFDLHFRQFCLEANQAVFDNGRTNQAIRVDALQTPMQQDLVYIDPPYLNSQGIGVDYRDFYHFLEGLMMGLAWSEQVDYESRHRRLKPALSDWNSPDRFLTALEALIQRHQASLLILSYRDDGLPTQTQLLELLHRYKKSVTQAELSQQYVLSTRASKEILLIAR